MKFDSPISLRRESISSLGADANLYPIENSNQTDSDKFQL